MTEIPIPADVVQAVEDYIHKELSDAQKYDNSSPLDESGIWSLHRLAANIYAKGFDAGCRIELERQRQSHIRQREQVNQAANQ